MDVPLTDKIVLPELTFRVLAWEDVAPEEWLRQWSALYGEDDEYERCVLRRRF